VTRRIVLIEDDPDIAALVDRVDRSFETLFDARSHLFELVGNRAADVLDKILRGVLCAACAAGDTATANQAETVESRD